MNKSLVKAIVVLSLFGVAQSSTAKDWFGKNNRGGSFGGFGNNGGCSDWPEWTPMYWMQEMSGKNDNCYPSSAYSGGYGGYANLYQSPYAYGAGNRGAYGANPYLMNPYTGERLPAYGQTPYGAQPSIYSQNRAGSAYGSRNLQGSPFGNRGLTGIPSFGGNNFTSPFSSFSGASSPFSSFGGGASPWSSFTSPTGFGGMPGMSPMSPFSPMGGFGSPMSMGTMSGMGMPGMSSMSPLSPMGGFGSPMSMGTMPGMGMPGMSPLSGFGGNPFGGGASSFNPFSR